MTGSLPVSIPPREARTVALVLRLKGESGKVTKMVGLVVDDQGMKNVSFKVTGRIVQRAESARAD